MRVLGDAIWPHPHPCRLLGFDEWRPPRDSLKICFCHSKWQKSHRHHLYCICVFLAVLLAFSSWDTYCQALVSAWVLLQVWTVVEWPWPTTFKQKQQFEFCKRLPQINFSCTKALTSKRNASFTRRAKVGQVFSRIKVHIYHCPVLRNPDPLLIYSGGHFWGGAFNPLWLQAPHVLNTSTPNLLTYCAHPQ